MSDSAVMMKRAAVAFTQIRIRSTPGIEQPFSVDELSPGVNIILGPNGSGKSTIARSIHGLLWPKRKETLQGGYSATMQINGENWLAHFESGRMRYQRNGVDSGEPGLGHIPVETCDRYLLALHQLISEKNEKFADTIRRESAGGYDLESAVRTCDFRTKNPTRVPEVRKHDDARDSVKKADEEQRLLFESAKSLNVLRGQRDAARVNAARTQLLETALVVLDQEQQMATLRERLGIFHPAMEKIRGDEVSRLGRIKSELASCREQEQAERQSFARETEIQHETGLVGISLAPGLLEELRTRCTEIQRFESTLASLEPGLQSGLAALADARARLGTSTRDEQLSALDASGLRESAQLAREYEAIRADLLAQETLREWIGRIESPAKLDHVRDAITIIAKGLQLGSPEDFRLMQERHQRLIYLAMAVIIALSILLGYFVTPDLYGLAILGFGFLWLSRRDDPAEQLQGRFEQLNQEFNRLDLPPDLVWNQSELARIFDRSIVIFREQSVALEKAQRWSGLEEKHRLAVQRAEATDEERKLQLGKFGIAPGLESATLQVIVDNLVRWQQAVGRVKTEVAQREEIQRLKAASLAAMNLSLAPFGFDLASDYAGAQGLCRNLEDRINRFDRSRQTQQATIQALTTTIQPAIQRLESDLEALYSSIDIPPGDEYELQRCVERREEYQDLVNELNKAQAIASGARTRLAHDQELTTLGDQQLRIELLEAEYASRQVEELTSEISRIETLVQAARGGHSLEDTLSAEATALVNLRESRDREVQKQVGWEVAQFVHERTRDLHRPQVFKRAQEIFAQVTDGAYTLVFDDNGSAFRAIDSNSGRGLSLDELSSGSRVQLLLAVRMAFVEQMETGPMLPLLLDEALGNTDEARAISVIDAALSLSSLGRQIFYFTAQQDEVTKWASRLSQQEEITWKVIDLAAVRNLAAQRLPETHRVELDPAPSIPAPEGHTSETYRVVLQVPPVNAWAESIGALPMWYLLPEPSQLWQCLKLGISNWGRLSTLCSVRDRRITPEIAEAYRNAGARARVYEALILAWRVGRARPIDRSVLVGSGALSEVYEDRVCQLSETLNGDAARLIARLEGGAIGGFRASQLQKLRTHLAENGYLPEVAPLSSEELRHRVMVAVMAELEDGLLTQKEVDAILDDYSRPDAQAAA